MYVQELVSFIEIIIFCIGSRTLWFNNGPSANPEKRPYLRSSCAPHAIRTNLVPLESQESEECESGGCKVSQVGRCHGNGVGSSITQNFFAQNVANPWWYGIWYTVFYFQYASASEANFGVIGRLVDRLFNNRLSLPYVLNSWPWGDFDLGT